MNQLTKLFLIIMGHLVNKFRGLLVNRSNTQVKIWFFEWAITVHFVTNIIKYGILAKSERSYNLFEFEFQSNAVMRKAPYSSDQCHWNNSVAYYIL